MKSLLTIRIKNGPHFVSNLFDDTCESLDLKHKRISVKTSNMNAHIESFHAILERRLLQPK